MSLAENFPLPEWRQHRSCGHLKTSLSLEALSFLLLAQTVEDLSPAHLQALKRNKKNLKKKQQLLKHIANHAHPIAGATSAATSEEIPLLQETPNTRQRASREVYSVRFVQHKMKQ